MRSKLFVPASRPELFEKAMSSLADSVCFDFEDAVLPHRKLYAREQLAEFLASESFHLLRQETRKDVLIRVNPMDTEHFLDDLHVACVPGVDVVNVPKINTAEDILNVISHLEEQEKRISRILGAKVNLRILANIETPLALFNAVDIAAAHEKVWGLQLGLGDLFEPLSIDRHDPQNVHFTMMSLRMAAGASGKIAYDSAYTDVENQEGYRQEVARARRLGFLGKSCIHPSQVTLANEGFSPTKDEVEWAKKVILSAQENDVNGAYMLEGKMIDAPFIERALDTLRQAGLDNKTL